MRDRNAGAVQAADARYFVLGVGDKGRVHRLLCLETA